MGSMGVLVSQIRCAEPQVEIYGKLAVFQPKVCSAFKVNRIENSAETDSQLNDTLVTLNR